MTTRHDIPRVAAAPERGGESADIAGISRQDVLTLIDEALATQAAAHAVEMSARDAAISELKAVVQAMSAAGASSAKPEFVALKRATFSASDYEKVRTWCEKGLIVARKHGRLWFVDSKSLNGYRAIRAR
jgi:DNA-binding GntR family transcriptional regulator